MFPKIFRLLALASTLILLVPETQAQKRKQRKAQAKATAQTEANLRRHIGILAADSLQGRRTGTEGERMAVDYLVKYYTSLGIPTAPGAKDYVQPFTIDEGKEPAPSAFLTIDNQKLAWGKDYFAPAWSAAGNIKATTSVALHEGGEPWWTDVADALEENAGNPHFLLSQWLQDQAKTAAEKGATALLVYNSGAKPDSLSFQRKDRSAAVPLPVWYITAPAIKRLGITESSSPAVQGSISFAPKTRQGHNVVAWLDNKAAQTIVLGAHLDHLGYGEDENSRYTGTPAIHNGADDNASGTAALLEMARLLKAKTGLTHNFLFVHFSGEELGLYGSKYYTENPLTDLKQVNYMINMDMVGRLNDSTRTLTVGGFGTSPSWPNLLQLGQQKDFTIKIDSSGTGPSDHTSFYRKDIPVLFFFTGLHTDYHKPSDDADRINYTGLTAIVQYIGRVIEASNGAGKLAFTKTREQQMGTGRFRVSMGIMPDYTFSGTGVKADGLIDGRAAQKAGIQTGDIIVQLGEHLITGMDTYMQALNRFDKGQTTTVTVRRGGETKEMTITF